MSTVPKLTYAKIGNKSKNKMEVSSELSQSQDQKSEDLFSHMNQENLNYIKKQLKMKKNRSVHEQSRAIDQQAKEQEQNRQEEMPQRDRLFNTFQVQGNISDQQHHLQFAQRKSSEEKPLILNLPEDSEQEYQEPAEVVPEVRKKLSTSQNNIDRLKQSTRKETDNSKMYHSVPYPDQLGKKRMTSIEGYFGEAMSINLNQNQNQEPPNFIDSLDDYILDLHQSKNLKPNIIKEVFIQKEEEEIQKSRQVRQSLQHQRNDGNKKEQNRIKLEQMKKSSDTFGGDPKNRLSVRSQQQRLPQIPEVFQFELELKQQKLNGIQLAQQIQKTRKLLDVKDEIIKSLQLNNELLKEEVMHMQISQSIILKNKKQPTQQVPILEPREQFSQKPTRRINNENLFYEYEPYPHMNVLSHARRGSGNPNANRYIHSYRDRANRLRIDDFADQNDQIYEPQYLIKNSRMETPQRDKSIQKLKRQYQQFLMKDKDRPNFKKGSSKYKNQLF